MATFSSEALPARGRSWLMPHNRRLRHLVGISLRNLTVKSDHGRRRAESLDDEALLQSRESPAKLRLRQNRHSAEHSRSSTDLTATLQSIEENTRKSQDVAQKAQKDVFVTENKTPLVIRPKRLRRRSTLDTASMNSTFRQKLLEDEVLLAMLDVFVSIHVQGLDDPIYVSECCEHTSNPTFQALSLFDQDPWVTSLSTFTLTIWAKSDLDSGFGKMAQSEIDMRQLQFVGKRLDTIKRPFPKNCVLFQLKDGFYTLALEPWPLSSESIPRSSSQILYTSSYDALMRLSNLDVCVQDAVATRKRLELEIGRILEQQSKDIATVHAVVLAQDVAQNAQNALSQETKRHATTRARREHLRTAIHARKEFMSKSREFYAAQIKIADNGEDLVAQQRAQTTDTKDKIHGQQRRVCEDLQRIFPIDPLPNAPQRSLAFTIRNLSLPNASVLDEADGPADVGTIAAALGYTALLITQLAAYLNVPLPYSLDFRGSSSTITDSLSASTPTMAYPLFSRSVARFRFEYAVFLLNKDIEMLANALGLKLLDPRHTLPNLKYILFVASFGQGDLPMRKAGGLKAFLYAETAHAADGVGANGQRMEWIQSFANGYEAKSRGSRLRYET